MSFIEFKNICKKYAGNDKNSVTDFNLDIEEKEFIAFVGPSGCGKSTTLRMIAGFEEITSGDLFIDGKRVNEVAPADRGISMVFQNYALYPHMTVEKNISYGLKNMKVPADEIKKKVDWAIDILGLEEYRYRKPKNLSGGQRQRVALGRAIVKDQKVFLMDEPLSNLDAKLRVSMRNEISKLLPNIYGRTYRVAPEPYGGTYASFALIVCTTASTKRSSGNTGISSLLAEFARRSALRSGRKVTICPSSVV